MENKHPHRVAIEEQIIKRREFFTDVNPNEADTIYVVYNSAEGIPDRFIVDLAFKNLFDAQLRASICNPTSSISRRCQTPIR